MKIYFYDKDNRYIGNRTLKENEDIPYNATTVPITLSDNQEAHFINGDWEVNEITIIEPTTSETILTLDELAVTVSDALVAIMELSIE
jgi:hypothetical protein